MMRSLLVPLAVLGLAACTKGETPSAGGWTAKAAQGQELYASLQTSLGTVVIRLFPKEAPETVKNFVGLATGEREWKDPRSGELVKGRSLYAGTIFHRVIPDFMIQGGDPLGSGTGDPGYRFADEFKSGRGFDKPGLLAMANSGPNTNGSQFFITTSTPRHLDGHHTIFGEVVKGYEVVTAISQVPRGMMDRPQQKVQIVQITLTDALP
jgi:peptidyl-prolyl cis-trans isomerase A (cyclophilin A)